MRIVFIRSNPVNPDIRVEKEVASLIKFGHSVEILAWDRDANYSLKESFLEFEEGRVKISRIGILASYGGGLKRNLLPLLKFQFKIFWWLIRNKNSYDVIHACDFDTGFVSGQISKRFKKKLVYDIFDYYADAFNVPNSLKKIISNQENKIINSADAVILCTEKRIEQIKCASAKKLIIIHNSPSVPIRPLKKMELNKNKIKIVYVGILGEGRFIKELVDTIKDRSEYEFHIGGFGYYEGFLKENATNSCNIFFYGKLPYERTLELENSCDIMVAIYDPNNTNHKYAAPNKFYEALMLGKPLIMAKDTGMSEIVLEKKIGIAINYNEKALNDALEELKELREEFPRISKDMKLLYQDYNWINMEQKLRNLYEELQE